MSTSKYCDVCINFPKGGWQALVHYVDIIDSSLSSFSVSHLFKRFFSAKTPIVRLYFLSTMVKSLLFRAQSYIFSMIIVLFYKKKY